MSSNAGAGHGGLGAAGIPAGWLAIGEESTGLAAAGAETAVPTTTLKPLRLGGAAKFRFLVGIGLPVTTSAAARELLCGSELLVGHGFFALHPLHQNLEECGSLKKTISGHN